METRLSFSNNLFISASVFSSHFLSSLHLSSPLYSLILSFSPHLFLLSFPPPPLLFSARPLLCPRRPDPACPWPGPKLCPLSLLSHHSSLLPWCRLRPFAAYRKSRHGDRKLQPWRDQQLCHSGTRLHLKRRWWRLVWLRPVCGRPLPYPAVLPVSGGIALQQVWTCPTAWRDPAAFTFHRLHSERPQVGWKGCVWKCVRRVNKFGKICLVRMQKHRRINLYYYICEDIGLIYIQAYLHPNPNLYIPCYNHVNNFFLSVGRSLLMNSLCFEYIAHAHILTTQINISIIVIVKPTSWILWDSVWLHDLIVITDQSEYLTLIHPLKYHSLLS